MNSRRSRSTSKSFYHIVTLSLLSIVWNQSFHILANGFSLTPPFSIKKHNLGQTRNSMESRLYMAGGMQSISLSNWHVYTQKSEGKLYFLKRIISFHVFFFLFSTVIYSDSFLFFCLLDRFTKLQAYHQTKTGLMSNIKKLFVFMMI